MGGNATARAKERRTRRRRRRRRRRRMITRRRRMCGEGEWEDKHRDSHLGSGGE
jgi:hypothetical protein